MFRDKKFVLVFSFGRSCSTLATNIFNSLQDKPTVSQEISFEKMIKILIKKFDNKSYVIDKEIIKYFNLLIKYISESSRRNILPVHPHYRYKYDIVVPEEGKTFTTFEDMVDFIFENLFNVRSQIVGCKILIGGWEKDLNKVIEIFKKNTNIFPILVLRNYKDMSSSRKKKHFGMIREVDYNNFVNNNILPVLRVENMKKDFKDIISSMDIQFDNEKFNKVMNTRHSF